MKIVKTYTATIYCGTRPGYFDYIVPIQVLETACQEYCDKVGLGLTFTPTKFLYTNGHEPGVIVGLINYPRFPKLETDIRNHALTIARMLLKLAKQERVSVVFTDETIMIEKDDIHDQVD